ncbi:MAG: hypothetical protein ACI9W4_000200 [Rhodothermales bacterium]|jgi:hypothetical protein
MEEIAPDYARRLEKTAQSAAAKLREMSDAVAGSRPAPDKWCPKEILGHLIDSAVNNHVRFVRAAQEEELVFSGYDQEHWVTSQGYASADWLALVALWESQNLHLARVMALTPKAIRLAIRPVHNLGQVAWHALPKGRPATLEYLMEDYVHHVQHHLDQILK